MGCFTIMNAAKIEVIIRLEANCLEDRDVSSRAVKRKYCRMILTSRGYDPEIKPEHQEYKQRYRQ